MGAALGIESGDWDEALRTQVRAAAESGVDLVQVREPDLEAAALVGLVKAIVSDLKDTATRVLVNDRLDVAWAAGAAGVHPVPAIACDRSERQSRVRPQQPGPSRRERCPTTPTPDRSS